MAGDTAVPVCPGRRAASTRSRDRGGQWAGRGRVCVHSSEARFLRLLPNRTHAGGFMKHFILLLALVTPASAADYAIILTEKERAAMIEALDVATRSQGLVIARKTLPLYDKLLEAPTVMDQGPADQKHEEKKP